MIMCYIPLATRPDGGPVWSCEQNHHFWKGLGQGVSKVAEMMVLVVFLDSTVF